MTKFRHLPAAGRVIIVAVAAGVLAIAVVACATSYNAIYRLVGMLDLYGYRTTQTFPLMLDAAFLVAELAAILGGIMRAVTRSDEVSQGWPGAAMLLCGAGTIAFNVGHAYLIGGRGDPLTVWRCLVAALPPVLMMLSFQVLIAIVKWVMLHLGRPLNSATALSPIGAPAMFGTVPPGSPHGMMAPGAYSHLPSSEYAELGQNGQTEGTKRRQVEAYLAQRTPDELARLTAREAAADLTDAGMDVSERWVARILDEYIAAQRPAVRGRQRRGR
jgi:hypothetical protein